MKKTLLFLVILFVAKLQYAQRGAILQLGAISPSLIGCNIQTNTVLGYSIGYGNFSKYTDKLEGLVLWGYNRATLSFQGYEGVESSSGFGNPEYTFKNYNIVMPHNIAYFDYRLSYYLIPDKLALVGGLTLGCIFNNRNPIKNGNNIVVLSSQNLNNVKLNNSELSDITIIKEPQFNTEIVNLGTVFGVSYAITERVILYTNFTYYVTKYLGESQSFVFGSPNMLLINFGLNYKLMESKAQQRF